MSLLKAGYSPANAQRYLEREWLLDQKAARAIVREAEQAGRAPKEEKVQA